MLYLLLSPFYSNHGFFNLFRYITFRSAAALLTALVISFILAPRFIALFKRIQNGGQPIRDDGPEGHFSKKGTPTMGGLFALISMLISTLLWTDLSNIYIWVVMMVTTGFGLLGFWDDYLKVSKGNSKGISGKTKLFYQCLISLVAAQVIQYFSPIHLSSHLVFPFAKHLVLDLKWFYIAFVVLVIVGSSNAVNLTDGLDGLAMGPILIAAVCFSLICYLTGNHIFANYLQIHFVPGAGELTIFCSALIGAGLGFLWYNTYPAKIFMGDTGSLAFGAVIGVLSVITKHELVLTIIGGLFVLEALSVIIQVYYFKFTGGKRFFKMAPLHHHFEKMGWSETTIVIRFWIIAIIFALLGLSTLKLR